jgi:hypothetical protein
MSFTLCTSGSAIVKAGAGANAINLSGSVMNKFSDQVEGSIVAQTRRDWRVNYSTLPTDIQNILSDMASSGIAKQIISYDMSGYTSRFEAITMLNVHDDIVREGVKFLSDFKNNEIKTP